MPYVFENSMSTVLSSKNLGKLVPVIVKLSAPSTFRSVLGVIAVTVQSTSIYGTVVSTGIDP